MKCIYCKKQIDKAKEDYEPFGCDGDFIHIKCKPKAYEEMNKISKMTKEEFYKWMGISIT